MNANLQFQTSTIKQWCDNTTKKLSGLDISSANLDAEIILSYALGKNRTYLHAHDNDLIKPADLKLANRLLKQRQKRMPIAYIIGYKEFYGRNFIVSPSTLIPRPESEDIITILKSIIHSLHGEPNSILRLFDVGTGCGCLGITAKLEFPKLDVTLTDISPAALKVAKQNTKQLSADVKINKGNLLENYFDNSDIIIANLPYVDRGWERSIETQYEPPTSLFADNHGLKIIMDLISQSSKKLKPNSYIIIEADPIQHEILIKHAKKQSFKPTHHINFIIALKKLG